MASTLTLSAPSATTSLPCDGRSDQRPSGVSALLEWCRSAMAGLAGGESAPSMAESIAWPSDLSGSTAEVTLLAERTLTHLAHHRVVIESLERVRSYLISNLDLTFVLDEAAERISSRWGAEVVAHLSVVQDPESESEYMTLCVRRRHYEDAFLDELDLLSAEVDSWLRGDRDRLLVTTDFTLL